MGVDYNVLISEGIRDELGKGKTPTSDAALGSGHAWITIVYTHVTALGLAGSRVVIFSVAGILSMAFWHGIPLGIDFRGGTLVYVRFSHPPNDNALRSEIDRAGVKNFRIQKLIGTNEVLIDLPQEANEQALDTGRNT